jgi:hypothetical protein
MFLQNNSSFLCEDTHKVMKIVQMVLKMCNEFCSVLVFSVQLKKN